MKLIIISTTNEGEVLTEKEVHLDKYKDRKGHERYELPDNFSINLFIEEAQREELSREKHYLTDI